MMEFVRIGIIGNWVVGNAIIYVQAQEEWWTDTIHHAKNQAQWRIPGARFYKARWLSPQAAHIVRCAPIPQGKDTNDSSN